MPTREHASQFGTLFFGFGASCAYAGGMPKKRKPAEMFDEHVGDVVENAMNDARKTQFELADAIGMPRSLLGRSVRGTRPFTVNEFERVAGFLQASAGELLEDALKRYGGMEKLLAEHGPDDPMSDGSPIIPDDGPITPADNVTYLGHVKAPVDAAADENPRTGPKE